MKTIFAVAGLLAIVETGLCDVRIHFPLQRKVYQTNERIDLSVHRRADQGGLSAGELVLNIIGGDGSAMEYVFAARPAAGGVATEHLSINARLLRPGRYTIEAKVDGTNAAETIEVFSHLRGSAYRLIGWGARARNEQWWPAGEDNIGYNLVMQNFTRDQIEHLIRAGVDSMSCCVMSGGHQMDLRMECDWSDPNVIMRGGTRRAVNRAFQERINPTAVGVHFYDEPGLTWWEDPETKQTVPHMVPAQVAAYRGAFGAQPLRYNQVDPANPEHVRRWAEWARWKLGFMDAAWKDAKFGVVWTRPDFLSLTQSQYGWTAFTDGYYFNVVRSLPVISGHGGYHDFWLNLFNPSFFLEMALARDMSKPCWYLPCWYENTTSDQLRLEHNLCFQVGIDGLAVPPPLCPLASRNLPAFDGIVECNKIMARLGPVFTSMPYARAPVALLYSLSHLVHVQTGDMKMNYAGNDKHGRALAFAYLACKLIQQPVTAVVDEDVVDGTLAGNHRAVILAGIDYLDPDVVAGLEDFARRGGIVLKTSDSAVNVPSAVDLGVAADFTDKDRKEAERIAAEIAALDEKMKPAAEAARQAQEGLKRKDLPEAEKDKLSKALAEAEAARKTMEERKKELESELRSHTALRAYLAGARPMALALSARLEKAGIPPVFLCDNEGISASRHSMGDIEYLFAVNAAHDQDGDPALGMKAVTAELRIPDDGRPVYDAIHGGPADFARRGRFLEASMRFGPGAMRVFARTAKPIGRISAGAATVETDLTSDEHPRALKASAALLDSQGKLLCGAAPVKIEVRDSLGVLRYRLWRATYAGSLNIVLPLAANDPAGPWTVTFTELLSGTADTASLSLPAMNRCGALVGARRRAIFVDGEDGNVFRFVRLFRSVAVIPGTNSWEQAAARRLCADLRPWGIEARIVSLAEAERARTVKEDEAATLCGLAYTSRNSIKPGDGNPPAQVGYAVEDPAILIGTPESHSMIEHLRKAGFLPYIPDPDRVPGPGRGYVAWQREGLGARQESVTLIGYDDAGISEAVGTFYEFATGMEPLTPLALATRHSISHAVSAVSHPEPGLAWSLVLPDRADALGDGGAGRIEALTHDGSLVTVDPARGRVVSSRLLKSGDFAARFDAMRKSLPSPAPGWEEKYGLPGRIVKRVAERGDVAAVGYVGGFVRIVGRDGATSASRQMDADISCLMWSGRTLLVALSDGTLAGLNADAGDQQSQRGRTENR